MHTHPSPRRDFEGMEHRRKRAARLFAAGRLILAAIARELRVSRQSVSRWYRDWRRGGGAALRGLWGNIKGQELANRCAENLAEADRATRSGMARVRRSSQLPFSFLKHSGLSF